MQEEKSKLEEILKNYYNILDSIKEMEIEVETKPLEKRIEEIEEQIIMNSFSII